MKKRFVAVLCSFALALTLPMAAFAADEAADPAAEPTPLAEAPADPFTVEVDGDTTEITVEEGTFEDGVYDAETGTWEDVNILEEITVEGAENVEINKGGDIKWDEYDDEAVEEYNKKLDQVIADKGEYLFQIELNGDVTADDHAVVTFQLNADEYGNKVINYYILHKDGSIQEKVVRVHADGTVRIWMESFSIITFMDVDGITKYENMVEPQDGDLLSPKTGF